MMSMLWMIGLSKIDSLQNSCLKIKEFMNQNTLLHHVHLPFPNIESIHICSNIKSNIPVHIDIYLIYMYTDIKTMDKQR